MINKFSLALIFSLATNLLFAQNNLQVAFSGQSNQIKLRLPASSLNNIAKCNIDVIIPGVAVYGQEVEAPGFEFTVDVNPQQTGTLTIKWEGKTKFRGLGTVMACPGEGAFQINVESNTQQIKEKWLKYFSQLSSENSECIKYGLMASGIKHESLDPLAQLTSPDDSKVKPVFEKCDTFFKMSQPRKGVSCVLPSQNNLRTICDGVYAERQSDGRLRVISFSTALQLHFEGKQWTVGISENVDIKASRLRLEEDSRLRQAAEMQARQETQAKIASEQAAKALAEQQSRQQAEEREKRLRESPDYKKKQDEIARQKKELELDQERKRADELAAKSKKEQEEAERKKRTVRTVTDL
jgi:hypothetical protein